MKKVFKGNETNINGMCCARVVQTVDKTFFGRVGDGGYREVPPRQADAASTDQPAALSSKISAGEPRA